LLQTASVEQFLSSGHGEVTMGRATGKRILLVDDEPSIRLTLPPILKEAGFDVHVAESVGDAIFEINSHQFDVLISDLNISEEGDGFLVTTAMRHIQPDCATFILTGYPAFETALQAIHNQVDEYLVKPVEVDSLITTVSERLMHRLPKLAASAKPVPVSAVLPVLRENTASIIDETLNAMEADARASGLAFSPAELANHLKLFISALREQLEQESAELGPEALRSAAEHGRSLAAKKEAGIVALTREFRHLADAVYRAVQNKLTSMDLPPTLLSDLSRLNRGVSLLLERSLEGFLKKGAPVSRK
jgi:ActR/RegA family two-component response regulator